MADREAGTRDVSGAPSRPTAQRVLLVVGALTLALALVGSYVHDTIADSDEFADRAQVAFEQPAVREQLTQSIVARIIDEAPDLLAVQALLTSVVDGVLSTEEASALVRASVRDLHRTLLTDDEDTVLLEVADIILVAKTQVTALDTELGARIPDDLTESIIEVRARVRTVEAAQSFATLDRWVLLLLAVALAAFVTVMWRAPDASVGLVGVGVALVGASLAAMTTAVVGRWVLIDSDDPVSRAVWDAFVDPFDVWVAVVGALGTILATVAWFGVGVSDLPARRAQVARLLEPRTRRRDRVLWGGSAAAAGLVVVLNPQPALRLAVTLAGVFVVAAGVRELVAALFPSLVVGAAARHHTVADGQLESDVGAEPDRRRPIGRAVATVVLVAAAAGAVAFVRSAGADPDVESSGCNGREELCDRRFDEVVLAATHNSHAAAADGFLNGYQAFGIERQLADGIRGFLIDVYFGFDDGSIVVTDRAPLGDDERELLVADIGEGAVAAAEATRASFEEAGVRAELYLCHALCEIGAAPLVDELALIKRFLDDHPREVVSIVIQDEGPLPADIAAAFEESGLIDLVHAQDLAAPFPTLAEMIDADRRVFVAAENEGGEFDWYHQAFDYVQDTRFDYGSVSEFDCGRFRGDADSPLLLVNHWVNPVSPTGADSANEASVLLDRAGRCREERGSLPNLIAVDFYERGDLIAVVDRLN